MLFEITSSLLAGSLVGYSYFQKNGGTSDHAKIQKIAAKSGLMKEGESFRILRRSNKPWGAEYAYQLPQGSAFKEFEKKLDHFQDGLNVKKSVLDLSLKDVRAIDFKSAILPQVKAIIEKRKRLRKEVSIDYDGAIIFRVYNEPLTTSVPYDESTLRKCKGWTVPVGQSRIKYHFHDFDKIAHVIVAGGTDKGKSVFLKNVITTLTLKQPDNVTFTLIDLKGGLEFNRFKNLRQVTNFAKNAKEALEALKGVQERLEQTMQHLLENGYENVKEAGYKGRHFVVVDEAAEISSHGEPDADTKKIKIECEKVITDIARRGRACGFRLVYATQYPTNETIRSQVRQNIGARICFRLETAAASLAVLDETGAEDLPLIPGRAIYRTDTKCVLQTPHIENGFIKEAIAPHIKFRPRKDEVIESTCENDTTGNEAGTDPLIFEDDEVSE